MQNMPKQRSSNMIAVYHKGVYKYIKKWHTLQHIHRLQLPQLPNCQFYQAASTLGRYQLSWRAL